VTVEPSATIVVEEAEVLVLVVAVAETRPIDAEAVVDVVAVVTTPVVTLLVGDKAVRAMPQQEHALEYRTVPEHAEA